MNKLIKSLLLITYVISISCNKEINSNNSATDNSQKVDSLLEFKKGVNAILHDYYLWYTKVPTVNINAYPTANDLLYALIYKPTDKWSFIISETDYQKIFIEGKAYGHGFSYAIDTNSNVRVLYVYSGTSMYKSNITRGWIIKQINGVTINSLESVQTNVGSPNQPITNVFTFTMPNGTDTTISLTKEEILKNEVITAFTDTVNNYNVGYLVFNSFTGKAKEHLTETFKLFDQKKINALIVDLRYNGGGDMAITQYLASIIAGNKLNNKLFLEMSYNRRHKDSLNLKINFETTPYTLDIKKVVFITSQASASASEALINGLLPYIDVTVIGSKTHGKPVGMNGFKLKFGKSYLFPITFILTNVNGYGDYFNGLPVNKEVLDDITHNWGKGESCYNQAMHYLKTGSFTTTKSAFESKVLYPVRNGIEMECGKVY